jgi:hypothetical protein
MNKEELTPNIPNFAQYLIIGGGATALSALKSIRAHDPTAKVCFYFTHQFLFMIFNFIRFLLLVQKNIIHICVLHYQKIFGIQMMMIL